MKFLSGKMPGINSVILYSMGLIAALAVKYGFSRASSDDLLWLLTPTALLVECLTGIAFVHESPVGFVNAREGIIIATVCSGMNFMILTFCMLVFSFLHRFEQTKRKWQWFAFSIFASYICTLAVNGARIAVSMYLIAHDVHYGWLTAERFHRLAGIAVYFIGLLLLYLMVDRITAKQAEKANVRLWVGKTSIATIPLCWYLLMTVGVPLLNGGLRTHGEHFAEHSFTVVIFSIIILGVLYCVRTLWRRAVCGPVKAESGRYPEAFHTGLRQEGKRCRNETEGINC